MWINKIDRKKKKMDNTSRGLASLRPLPIRHARWRTSLIRVNMIKKSDWIKARSFAEEINWLLNQKIKDIIYWHNQDRKKNNKHAGNEWGKYNTWPI